MWSFLSFGSSRPQATRRQRKEERFPTNLLSTNLGEVVDISASGVRVRCEGRPGLAVGQVVPLTIRSPQCKVVVQTRVVRVGKTRAPGQRGIEVSCAFLDAKPGLRAAIAHLGRFGFIPHLDLSSPTNPPAAPGGRSRATRAPLPDYYGLLGVSPDATAEEIRHAYHRLARDHHPDVSRSADSVGIFEALVQAYQVLRDTQKRAAYDAARKASAAAAA